MQAVGNAVLGLHRHPNLGSHPLHQERSRAVRTHAGQEHRLLVVHPGRYLDPVCLQLHAVAQICR